MLRSTQPRLSHLGLYVRDVELMVHFYSELFGLRVTDRGRGRTFNTDLVFMSADPEHHHQLVIASGRPPEATFSTIMQLSFKADAIDDLRRAQAKAPMLGASKLFTLNHGAFAAALRLPLATLNASLHRARKKLRLELTRAGVTP